MQTTAPTILIVQSLDQWLQTLRNFMGQRFSSVKTLFTDSYDHAIEICPKEGKVLVITSEWFHDNFAKNKAKEQYPDNQKNANNLAMHLKSENKNIQVFSFSEHEPEEKSYLDGCILKGTQHISRLKEVINIYIK